MARQSTHAAEGGLTRRACGGDDVLQGWAAEFQRQMAQSAADDPSNPWLQEFTDSLDANDAFGRGAQEYQFAENNPYLTHADPYSEAQGLFRDGLLSEAALALEAELQRGGDRAEVWRLLGPDDPNLGPDPYPALTLTQP